MDTAICSKCGAQIPAGFHFCGNCGAPVERLGQQAALPDQAGLYYKGSAVGGTYVSTSDQAMAFFCPGARGLCLVKPDMTTLRRQDITPCKIVQKDGKILCLDLYDKLTLYRLDMGLQVLEKRELMSWDAPPSEDNGSRRYATMNDRSVFLIQYTAVLPSGGADFFDFSMICFDIATNKAKVFAPQSLVADGVSVCSLNTSRLLCDGNTLYFEAKLSSDPGEEDAYPDDAILAFDADTQTLSIFWRSSDAAGKPYFFDFAHRRMWTALGFQESLTPHPLDGCPDTDNGSYEILVPRPIARNAPILASPDPRVLGGTEHGTIRLSNCQYLDGTHAYGVNSQVVYSGIYGTDPMPRDRRFCPLTTTAYSVMVWPQQKKVFIPSYDFPPKFLVYPMDFWHDEDFHKDSGLPPLQVKDVV